MKLLFTPNTLKTLSGQIFKRESHCHRSFVTVTSHWRLSQACTSKNLPRESVFSWENPFLRQLTRPFQTKTMDTPRKRALVIITDGSEELESVAIIDTLRRGGVDVTVAGLNHAGETKMSRNVIVVAEVTLKDALKSAPYDAVVLPGGAKGSDAFIESDEIGELLREQETSGRLIAAICAAPTALHKHDICIGRKVTSYPAMQGKMLEGGKYNYKEDIVVIDGNLITSRGPATAIEFSLAIVKYLVDNHKSEEVRRGMLATTGPR